MGGVSGQKFGYGARKMVGLAELVEVQIARGLGQQSADKGRGGREDRDEAVAEGRRALEIIRLEKGERAFIDVARIGRLQHLESEKVGALGRLVRHEQHGQGGRQLLGFPVQQARAHAGRRSAAALTHSNLPDSALPGEKVLAEVIGGRLAHSGNSQVQTTRPILTQDRHWVHAVFPAGKLISCPLTVYRRRPSILVNTWRGNPRAKQAAAWPPRQRACAFERGGRLLVQSSIMAAGHVQAGRCPTGKGKRG